MDIEVRMKTDLLRLTLAATLGLTVLAGPAGTTIGHAQDRHYEMGTFYLALLIKPANWTGAQTAETKQLLQNHFKHVQSLIASGKAAIAGPFGDDTGIAGVFVLNASSPEEARALEEADPLVKS